MTSDGGWGSGRYGPSSWGGLEADDLQVLSAIAIRENAVRLTFNAAPFIDGLLTPNDASNPLRYAVTAVAGTQGLDDLPVRDVLVLYAEVAQLDESFGSVLDVWVDRPFSPFPAQYTVAVNNLVSSGDGLPLDPAFSSIRFYGMQRLFVPNTGEGASPSRDIGSPQAPQDALSTSGGVLFSRMLGTYQVDDTGDYALDDGIANLRKRVFRRLLTEPGGFAHLPDYGVGVLGHSKRLSMATVRQALADEAQRQVKLEPDVQAVSVTTSQPSPGLVVFSVAVRTTSGVGGSIDVPVPVSIS